MEMIPRVAIYTRVSTNLQVDGYSLEGQQAVLREDARKRGKTVYRVYQDAGLSGAKEDRKALNEMLRDARRGCFDEVLVWSINRISRKLSHLLKIAEELKSLGVSIRSKAEQFNLDTPVGKFTLSMMGAVAQMQRESWIESSRIAQEKRVRSGRWHGGSVLGYRCAPDSDDPRGGNRLEVVNDEAEMVKRIFILYAEGHGYKAIANRLNEAGLKSKTGRLFSVAAIKKVLTDPVYIGRVRLNGQTSDGLHDPIINSDLWEQVRERLSKKSHPVRKFIAREYLLSGILRCPACGGGMVPTHSKYRRKDGTFLVSYYYSCGAYLSKGRSACQANQVRAAETEEEVLRLLVTALTNPFWIRKVYENIRQEFSPQNESNFNADEARKHLEEIARDQRQLLLQYENDQIDPESFRDRMKDLRAEKEECQNRIPISYSERNESSPQITMKEVKNAFGRMRAILDQASPDKKRELIRHLIKRITLTKERKIEQIEFQLPINDENQCSALIQFSGTQD